MNYPILHVYPKNQEYDTWLLSALNTIIYILLNLGILSFGMHNTGNCGRKLLYVPALSILHTELDLFLITITQLIIIVVVIVGRAINLQYQSHTHGP